MENEEYSYWPAGETPQKDRPYITGRGHTWKPATEVSEVLPSGRVIVKYGDKWYYAKKNANPNGRDIGDYFTQSLSYNRFGSNEYPENIKPVYATNAVVNYLDSLGNTQSNVTGFYLADTDDPYMEESLSGKEYRSFDDAYKAAVDQGLKTFIFNGKSYNTNNNPNITKQEMSQSNNRLEERSWTEINGKREYTPWQIVNPHGTSFNKQGGLINYFNLF